MKQEDTSLHINLRFHVTQGMLTNQLRELERDGPVERKVFQEIPPKVEYSMTDHGKTLGLVLSDMCGWGFKHMDYMSEATGGKHAGTSRRTGEST